MNEKVFPINNELSPMSQETDVHDNISDLFPIVQMPKSGMERYKKVPVAGLAALGAAFSQLPQVARTIVQTTTTNIATNETLFVGINPNGVPGYLLENQFGTVGNIMQINEQGKQVIAGRMRFKALDSLPVTETQNTVVPFDPTLMVIAVAVMAITQKLDKIQASVEAVLQFLELEKQAKQRGNLRKLAEIAEDYKSKCRDEAFCTSRNHVVQSIQIMALQDIEFYQEKVGMELQKQKALHLRKEATTLMDSVILEFAEYQLACYIYSFCCFLDIMLRRDFAENTLKNATAKMEKMASRYDELYTECRSQIAQYQRNAIEAKVVGGIGLAAKGLGKAIGSIPVIRDGFVDEALINAGANLGKHNRDIVAKQMTTVDAFEDNRMASFIESLSSINLMYNAKDSLLTDGENIYVLSVA